MKVIDKQTLQRSRMLVCNLRETPSRWSTLAALMVIAAYQWAALPVVTHAFQGDAEQDITETDPKAAAKQETLLLANARQLTFEGRRAGEGYFSADGSQLVFQSERQQGNPFFQIYVMDLETGDLER